MQVLEYRVNALGHLRHPGKDLFFGVAIDQHAGTPPCACFFFYPYSLTYPAFFHTVTFPSLVHVVSSRSTGCISHRILVLQRHLNLLSRRGDGNSGSLQDLQHASPPPVLAPASVATLYRMPGSKAFRQRAPERSCSYDPQDPLHDQSMIAGWTAGERLRR